MQENQLAVFLSDGGDSVQELQAYLHPDSEQLAGLVSHYHAYHRAAAAGENFELKGEQPKIGEEVARELESIKHFLRHGNTF